MAVSSYYVPPNPASELSPRMRAALLDLAGGTLFWSRDQWLLVFPGRGHGMATINALVYRGLAKRGRARNSQKGHPIVAITNRGRAYAAVLQAIEAERRAVSEHQFAGMVARQRKRHTAERISMETASA